jgi:hypothetical protein
VGSYSPMQRQHHLNGCSYKVQAGPFCHLRSEYVLLIRFLIFLSNIVSANGCMLLLDVLQGQPVPDCVSSLEWPLQHIPLHVVVFSGTFCQYFRQCDVLRRHWVTPPHQTWQWFQHTNTAMVYNKSPTGHWSAYHPYLTPSLTSIPPSLS